MGRCFQTVMFGTAQVLRKNMLCLFFDSHGVCIRKIQHRGILGGLEPYRAMRNTREHDKLQSAIHVETTSSASSTKSGHTIQT